MNEGGQDRLLSEGTKAFALRIFRLCRSLPEGRVEQMIGAQLLCCGASVGANYRSGYRARSSAQFRSKLGIAEEKADETNYWMELFADSGTMPLVRLKDLISEANEILAMVVASIRTSRNGNPNRKPI